MGMLWVELRDSGFSNGEITWSHKVHLCTLIICTYILGFIFIFIIIIIIIIIILGFKTAQHQF